MGPKTDVVVRLSGEDGNAFFIIGSVSRALREGGHMGLVKEFTDEAMSGDYDHVLQTCMRYVVVE